MMRIPSKDFLILLKVIEKAQNNDPLDFTSDLGEVNKKLFKITKDEFNFLKEELQETIDYLNDILTSNSDFEEAGYFGYALNEDKVGKNTYMLTIDYVSENWMDPSLYLKFSLK